MCSPVNSEMVRSSSTNARQYSSIFRSRASSTNSTQVMSTSRTSTKSNVSEPVLDGRNTGGPDTTFIPMALPPGDDLTKSRLIWQPASPQKQNHVFQFATRKSNRLAERNSTHSKLTCPEHDLLFAVDIDTCRIPWARDLCLCNGGHDRPPLEAAHRPPCNSFCKSLTIWKFLVPPKN